MTMSDKDLRRSAIKSQPKSRSAFGCLVLWLLFLATGLLLGLMVGLPWWMQEYKELTALRTSGIKAEAIVTHKRVDRSGDYDSYYLTYAYEASSPDGDGRLQLEREETVNPSLYKAVEKGGKVSIVYAPDDPAVSRVVDIGIQDWAPVVLVSLVALGALGLCLRLASLTFRQYLQARKLGRFGESTEGTVVDTWIHKDDEGFKTHCIIYQFDEGIQVVQTVKKKEFEKLAVGTSVTVRYLPDDPTCSRMER